MNNRAAPGRREETIVNTETPRRSGMAARAPRGEAGVISAEYAVVIMAAVAFAFLLLKVLTSASVRAALEGIVMRALSG